MENKKLASIYFREAADRVWDMAIVYEEKGHWELAQAIKDLATQLHSIAREKEIQEGNVLE